LVNCININCLLMVTVSVYNVRYFRCDIEWPTENTSTVQFSLVRYFCWSPTFIFTIFIIIPYIMTTYDAIFQRQISKIMHTNFDDIIQPESDNTNQRAHGYIRVFSYYIISIVYSTEFIIYIYCHKVTYKSHNAIFLYVL